MEVILDKLNGTSSLIEYKGRVVEIYCHKQAKSHPFSLIDSDGPLTFSFTNILLEMSFVLVLIHILRFLLKPLRQPKVVSDVLAGIIMGPSVIGRNKKYAEIVIPETSMLVIRNIGVLGLMFWIFVTAVKMDMAVISNAGKKHWVIAVVGVAIPHVIVWALAIVLREYMDEDLRKFTTIGGVISAVIVTTFPVIYSVLRDMQLLSSELSRIALLTVIISDLLGIGMIVIFEALKQGGYNGINALYFLITITVVGIVIIWVVPLAMAWINRQTVEGQPVEQFYVTLVLLGVFLVGFTTDCIGAAIGNGPLWLGLAIPDGPSIGSTIVQKSETFMSNVLLPFSYVTIGLRTDVFAMSECWSCLGPLFAMTIMAFVAKLVVVVMAARFMDMPYRDSIVLGLMLSLRGETEFFLYLHWIDLKMVKTPPYTMMVILTIIVTSIMTPLITILYDRTTPYTINKKRTVQHTKQESELRILACMYDNESVASLFTLLDVSNPTTTNPFTVFALYLVELVGRAAPVFIDHSTKVEYWDSNNEAIQNAINNYEEARKDQVKMNFFTSVTPQSTMYQDICELSLLNKVSFIILPFHKRCQEGGHDENSASIRPGVQSINANTLSHAPCSVGILSCKDARRWAIQPGRSTTHQVIRQFAMLFLGGPDAREALTMADRMVGHPDVSLIVIRFLASDHRGDDEVERKLDDGLVTSFWVKNETNEKVLYKEVVVTTGLETVSTIQSLNDTTTIDLWIVGRKHVINPTLLEGLSDWSENPELGIIGDFLVSTDFNTSSSVLVVQQQVLRDHRATPWICIDV